MIKNPVLYKYLIVGVIVLFIGLAIAPPINANINRLLSLNQENNVESLFPSIGIEYWCGFRNPTLYFYIVNHDNETFRGNISCNFNINASIILFGKNINISNHYVEIEPWGRYLLFHILMLGFGKVNATLEMPSPHEFHKEFKDFLLFIFLFLWWND